MTTATGTAHFLKTSNQQAANAVTITGTGIVISPEKKAGNARMTTVIGTVTSARTTSISSVTISDDGLEQAIFRESSIPLLEKRINQLHKQLKKLPSPPRKPSTLEPDFLQYYQSAVHPTLEETLSQKIRLPPVNLYGPQQCVDMDKLLTMPFDTCLALGWGAAPLFATGFAFYLQPHIYNVVFLSMLVPNLFMMGTMYKILVNEDVIFDKDNVNSYDHEKNTIRLTYGLWEETWTKEDLALTLVHELTHHYQHLNQWPDNDILMEGHARTVERKVADVLERSTGNEQWLRCPVQEELLELVPVYRKVCRKHDVVPKEYKLITPHSDIAAEDLVWDDPHCKGIALFRIAEHHKGQKVYDAVKKKNFDILVHHGA